MYNDAEAPARHKATAHYAAWAKIANPIMARPRSARKFRSIFPAPLFWHNSALHTHLGQGGEGSWGAVSGQGCPPLFSFQAPKITIGTGVAAKEIAASLKV